MIEDPRVVDETTARVEVLSDEDVIRAGQVGDVLTFRVFRFSLGARSCALSGALFGLETGGGLAALVAQAASFPGGSHQDRGVQGLAPGRSQSQPPGVCRPSRARVFKPRPVRHCPQRFCMRNRWSAGGLVVEDVAGFDGVEAVEADEAEGVTVGHLVVAVADFPVEHASGREIVDVSVLQSCRRGFLPFGLNVFRSAASLEPTWSSVMAVLQCFRQGVTLSRL